MQYVEVKIDSDQLLDETCQKIKSSPAVRQTISKNAMASGEIDDCIREANQALKKIIAPKAAYIPVSTELTEHGVKLKNGMILENRNMVRQYPLKKQTFVYLVTAGYDTQDAFRELNSDYIVYHFQHLIAKTYIVKYAQQFHIEMQWPFPGLKFVRYSVLMKGYGHTNGKDYWDPLMVRELISHFGENSLGVEVTEAGCFSPLYTLAGITMGISEP
ncbi:MAG: hypothetical protein HQM13_08035 [SAR324 cluster bacterium]|nr:hypothetical protein [SAR324 cluster bacterium]